MTYKIGSLFAGIGGIDIGFEQVGGQVVWANEFDKNACITYRSNFKNILVEEDIRKISSNEMPDVDIITAGWPCVAFSVAGNRHGMKYQCNECYCEHDVTYEEYITEVKCPKCNSKNTKAKDERGTLFFDLVRFIREKQPRAIFLENVKNLIGHDRGNTFKIILKMLEESSYHIKYKVLNTKKYGNIPQNRERIFIVGFRNIDDYNRFVFPPPIPLTNKLDDMLFRNVKQDDKYYYTYKSRYYLKLKKEVIKKDTVYQLRRVYVRENQSKVCPTLTANMGTGGNNVPIILDSWGIRKITPREALNFQGFPKNFIIPKGMADSHIYKQVGNAVSVPVVRRIAENLVATLDGVNLNFKEEFTGEQLKLQLI